MNKSILLTVCWMFALAGTPLVAQRFELPAEHLHTLRNCRGTLAISPDGETLAVTVTNAENIEHASINGFLRGPTERISESVACEICELLHSGVRSGEIAVRLGVTLEVVKKIRRRKTWTQVSAPYVW